MNIWIINHHALTPSMSGGTRHYDFALELLNRGHKVTIVASSFHYSKYKEMKEYINKDYLKENINGITFIWFKTPEYFGNGFSRVKNMLTFTNKVIKLLPKLPLDKPEIIIGSSVHLFAVFGAYKLSKLYQTPFIMEVRDLWPKTLIDMGISKWHPFILLLSFLEKYLYKKADKIITTLPQAHKYITSFDIPENKITWISNGTSLRNKILSSKNKFNNDKFNVLYTGAHGTANNLDLLIEVANKLKTNKKVNFTLIGDGSEKKKLIKKAKNYKLNNITFLDSIPKDKVFDYLSSADLLYVGLKNLPLYRYGMSMNKVFDYMSVKKPILFVSNIKDNIIEISNAGIVIKEDNIGMISDAIYKLSNLTKEELAKYSQNGYKYLEKNYSIEVLTDRLEILLKSEIEN